MRIKSHVLQILLCLTLVTTIVLGACSQAPTPAPTQDITGIQTQAAQTVVANLTANAPASTQPPAATVVPPPPGPTPDPNIPVAVVPTPAPGEPAAIANYNTTIYSGPGDNYVVYAAFLGSKTAKVVGVSEDGQWWVISVPPASSGQGWVSAAWVTVNNASTVPVIPTPPVPPTTDLVPPGPSDPQAVALVNVYVRTGPGNQFPAYGIAKAGASGRVIGKSEDGVWWVVRLNPAQVGAGYGWVMASYTQASNVEGLQTIQTPLMSEPVPPPTPEPGSPTGTALDYLNVRSGPGANYPILLVAPAGAIGEISGKSSDGAWWQVKISTKYASDGFGWASAAYVFAQNTENVPVVEAPPPPPTVDPNPPEPGPITGCALVAQTPADGTAYDPGTAFETTWVLQNTGDVSWDQAEFDLRYVGAAGNITLHQGDDLYDLANTVEPGWTYNFTLPMISPFDPGTYGEMWQVVHGSQMVCQFYVYIQVP